MVRRGATTDENVGSVRVSADTARRYSLVIRPLESPLGELLPHSPSRNSDTLGTARLLPSRVVGERQIQLKCLGERLRIVGWPSNGSIEEFSRIGGIETGGTD
jgi:hypothetical protein